MVIGIMIIIISTVAALIWVSGWLIICQAMLTNLFNEKNDEHQTGGHGDLENEERSGENMDERNDSEQSSSDYEWNYRLNYEQD